MPISYKLARDYVYTHGTLWERVLFGHLFESAPLVHLHQCLACYKNPDGGWGHGIEPDIKTPDSHPLAMEFPLTVFRATGLYSNNLFNDAPEWLERHRAPDGSLVNPPSVLTYPHAPWWGEGGQTKPTSIVGNLMRIGKCTPSLEDSTRRWVEANLTLEQIKANEWWFMAYHAHDYFMHVETYPDLDAHRQATLDNLIACAEQAPANQYYTYFLFATSPASAYATAMPPKLRQTILDALAEAQHPDGAWHDQHSLPQWSPWTTILVLNGLKQYGVWDGNKEV